MTDYQISVAVNAAIITPDRLMKPTHDLSLNISNTISYKTRLTAREMTYDTRQDIDDDDILFDVLFDNRDWEIRHD